MRCSWSPIVAALPVHEVRAVVQILIQIKRIIHDKYSTDSPCIFLLLRVGHARSVMENLQVLHLIKKKERCCVLACPQKEACTWQTSSEIRGQSSFLECTVQKDLFQSCCILDLCLLDQKAKQSLPCAFACTKKKLQLILSTALRFPQAPHRRKQRLKTSRLYVCNLLCTAQQPYTRVRRLMSSVTCTAQRIVRSHCSAIFADFHRLNQKKEAWRTAVPCPACTYTAQNSGRMKDLRRLK